MKSIKLRLVNNKITKIILYIARTIIAFKDYLKELYYLIILLVKFNIILDIL